MAHELHEGICQALAAMKMNLQTLQTRSPGAQLDECMRITDGILQRVRDLSLELRAPHELGLEAAVRSAISRRAANITVDFRTDTGGAPLHPALEMTCFRVIEEALANVYRHADAGRVWIELAIRDYTLQLTIDEGRCCRHERGDQCHREHPSLQAQRVCHTLFCHMLLLSVLPL